MSPLPIPVLADDPGAPFPDPAQCPHPEGLVAIGGDLARPRLLNAYRHGIFPWYEAGGPVLWWSPQPRAVLFPERMHVPRRLARTLRSGRFRITVNQAFDAVIAACAAPRADTDRTWITAEMQAAYRDLHAAGFAHSIEVYADRRLVGGLYGVALGRIFFAESKFHVQRDASKVALVHLMQRLRQRRFLVCDCQLWNRHLAQFGPRLLPREEFLRLVATGVAARTQFADE